MHVCMPMSCNESLADVAAVEGKRARDGRRLMGHDMTCVGAGAGWDAHAPRARDDRF